MKSILMIALISVICSCASHKMNKPKKVLKEVNYSTKTTQLKGFMAYQDDGKKKPGVIIIHEWWGHNDYVRQRAQQLADLGYVAFAIDMYGDGVNTAHPKEANSFMMAAMKNMPEAKARILKGFETLKANKQVDPEKIAAIGYCFGGGVVLQAVQMGLDLKAAVSFHGGLSGVKSFPKNSPTKVLVLNGEDDPMITQDHIANFKKQAKLANLGMQFINYPGAQHAFTNPGATEKGKKFNLPLAYNESADKSSWLEMKKLFDEVF